jgi:hypothetical protein
MNCRAAAHVISLVAGLMLLTFGSSSAGARQRAAGLDPIGDFTLHAQQRDGTQITATITVTRENELLAARIRTNGDPELEIRSVKVDGRTVTLTETLPQGDLLLVLNFDTDSTFSGNWSLGADGGTLIGQRGVTPSGCPSTGVDAAQPGGPASAEPRRPTTDPDSARIVTSDVRLFWDILDRSTPETLATLLNCEYLRGGTDAVRDFIPNRIISGERLAEMLRTRRERYDAARRSSMSLDTIEPAIRAVFREMKAWHPDAVFPDVYFVIGRLNTGGTVSERGLLIGAEMYIEHTGVPHIVAHELVHYQQRSITAEQRTLLAQSIMEGSADFVAELISGRHINSRAHEYARPREQELWQEFSQVMAGRDFTGWLYGNPPEGRPADLGYFFGYRIAQAYFEKTAGKPQALRDILGITDYAAFLKESGYGGGS